METEGADLDDGEADGGGHRQARCDAGQRRKDQAEGAEHLDQADQPDLAHRDGVHPTHHRRELLLGLDQLLGTPECIDGGEQAGDDPVGDVHGAPTVVAPTTGR